MSPWYPMRNSFDFNIRILQGLNQQCWKVQCAKCREYYLGIPTNGHQCYRQMHVEQTYCFEPNSHGKVKSDTTLNLNCYRIGMNIPYFFPEYCMIKPSPLKAGRTAFFAVQPKFMNVDIRINVDVTHGAVHMYLSPKEDTFVIRNEPNTFVHIVRFYKLTIILAVTTWSRQQTNAFTPFRLSLTKSMV